MTKDNKKLILFYNRMWHFPLFFAPQDVPEGYETTEDRNKIREADVVVFHLPSLKLEDDVNKYPGQVWIGWSIECEQHYMMYEDPEIKTMFDLMMTYHKEAEIYTPYFNYNFNRALRKEHDYLKKDGLICMFISSVFNKSNRIEHVQELMKYLPIDSFGNMFRNKYIPNDRGIATKLQVINRYKFTIAYENACGKDYVTEKFYEPLSAGSVPVYLGAPNVREFAPSADCYIDIRDFHSTRELADYLLWLDRNDAEYLKFFEWKKKPFQASFSQALERTKDPIILRLCNALNRYFQTQN